MSQELLPCRKCNSPAIQRTIWACCSSVDCPESAGWCSIDDWNRQPPITQQQEGASEPVSNAWLKSEWMKGAMTDKEAAQKLLEMYQTTMAQLAAVTRERDELRAAYEPSEHNPDGLGPAQYGTSEGWRLLLKSEVEYANTHKVQFAPLEIWVKGKWRAPELGMLGTNTGVTYRTKLPPAELAALRKGKE